MGENLWLSEGIQLASGAVPGGGVLIQFIKGIGQRYSTVVHRRDGVKVEVIAGGYNQVGGVAKRIPHDLAHFIIEDELGLDWGLWGLLTSGALLAPKNTRVIAGRQKAQAARFSEELLKRAGALPMQVELAVRTIADLALAGQCSDAKAFQNGMRREWPRIELSAGGLEKICLRLQSTGMEWQVLEAGKTLDVIWTRKAPKL